MSPFEEQEERLPTEQPDSSEPAGEQEAGNEVEIEEATERSEGEPTEGPQTSDLRPQGEGSEEDPLALAKRERAEFLELAQRTQADFENYKKRAAKDAAAAGQRAKAGLVRELLPVVDNLERALASAPEGDPLLDGVKLVHGELVAVLERSGVQGFDPNGEAFDPNEHEALTTRPAEGTDPGVVVDVVEKGYRLNGTVLRPARVVVSA